MMWEWICWSCLRDLHWPIKEERESLVGTFMPHRNSIMLGMYNLFELENREHISRLRKCLPHETSLWKI